MDGPLEYVGIVRPAGAAPRSNMGTAAGQFDDDDDDDEEVAASERANAMTVEVHRILRRQGIWTPFFIPHSLNYFTITYELSFCDTC